MACYLIVDQLIIGRRERENMDWENDAYTQALGQQMARGLTIALTAYSGLSRDFVDRFVQQSGIDWQMYGRQMSFWMRNDDKGYVKHVQSRKLPPEIYGDTSYSINSVEHLRGWNSQGGFMLNGTPDLGPVNGQNPSR